MIKRTHRRLTFVAIGAGLLIAATALVLSALVDTIVFFKSPSEIAASPPFPGQRLRVGGLVEEGSLAPESGGGVTFRITDTVAAVPVRYVGILPDLFREGQGVVAEGQLRDGFFAADRVFAKHDEKYMPPEAAEALKRSGHWQHVEDRLKESGQLRRVEAGPAKQ